MTNIPTHLNFKIEPRIRYLLEVAALAKGVSLTQYVESSLMESFSQVTLRKPEEKEPVYGDPLDPHNPAKMTIPEVDIEHERVLNEAMSISNRATDLWSESEFVRLRSLHILAPHLVSKEDTALLAYIHSRTDLRIPVGENYTLDKEKISTNFAEIRAAFAKQKKGSK